VHFIFHVSISGAGLLPRCVMSFLPSRLACRSADSTSATTHACGRTTACAQPMSETVEPYPYMVMAALIVFLMYGEVMPLAKVGRTLVGTSVMDERASFAMTFVRNCLRASSTTHLPLCVRMKLQEEYGVQTFPYFLL
jgi:hypothetical protein